MITLRRSVHSILLTSLIGLEVNVPKILWLGRGFPLFPVKRTRNHVALIATLSIFVITRGDNLKIKWTLRMAEWKDIIQVRNRITELQVI